MFAVLTAAGCSGGKSPPKLDPKSGPEPEPEPGFTLKEIKLEDIEPGAKATIQLDGAADSPLVKLVAAERKASIQPVLLVLKSAKTASESYTVSVRYCKKVRFDLGPGLPGAPYLVDLKALENPFSTTVELAVKAGPALKNLGNQEETLRALTNTQGVKNGDVVLPDTEIDGKPASLVAQVNCLLPLKEVQVAKSSADGASKTVELHFLADPLDVVLTRVGNKTWKMRLAP